MILTEYIGMIFWRPSFTAFLILFLFGCGGDDDPTGPGHETDPPTLLYTSPADGTSDAAVDGVIRATFSEPVSPATINSSTFTIDNGVTGSYSFNGNSVILTPSAELDFSTVYHAGLTTDITDTIGNHFAEAYDWSFTTEPDPATVPPTIVATGPLNNATNVAGDVVISATFSKEMDIATITEASFIVNNGATGTVAYADKVATFTPDDTLEYSTLYTATITSAVADTFGNNMEEQYDWNFTTEVDPYIPVVSITVPFDSAIVGKNVDFSVGVVHPVGAERVEFYIDNTHIPSADDYAEPFEYVYDASGWMIGSLHNFSARAFDGFGNVGYSDTLDMIYLWQELITDDNSEDLPQDVRRVLARSTQSILELRYEYAEKWTYPYPVDVSQFNEFSIDLGIYLDSDMNPTTGRPDFAGLSLNGLGADHRIIIGLHGGDTALAFHNEVFDPPKWDLVYDTAGLSYHNVPMDTNVLEFGVSWNDINSNWGVNIVNVHVYFTDTLGNFETDWIPDRGSGFLSVRRDDRYVGEESVPAKLVPAITPEHTPAVIRFNPFNAD